MKLTQERKIPADQPFVIDAFRLDDALGVANLFLSVYGPDYPIDTYYYPDKIIAAVQRGDLHLVVCRTPTNDIIAGGALYRSSPVNPNLLEIGLYMVLPDYRTTSAAFRITKYLSEDLMTQCDFDGFFGESVTNHVATQKVVRLTGGKDGAIELMLMPAAIYEKEKSARGRVGCVMSFRIVRDVPQTLYLPTVYATALSPLIARMGLARTLLPAVPVPWAETASVIDSRVFAEAGVVRANASLAGQDFPARLAAIEAEADAKQLVVRQWFVRLTDPAVGEVIARLRDKAYCFGGYLPRWFGDDGMLMQKTTEAPDYDAIRLYYDEAEALLEVIKADRRQLGLP